MGVGPGDSAEALRLEHRREANEPEPDVDSLAFGVDRIGLERGCALFAGMLDCCRKERPSDTLAAMADPDPEAADRPDGQVVDRGDGSRIDEAGHREAGPEPAPADWLIALVRDEPRRERASVHLGLEPLAVAARRPPAERRVAAPPGLAPAAPIASAAEKRDHVVPPIGGGRSNDHRGHRTERACLEWGTVVRATPTTAVRKTIEPTTLIWTGRAFLMIPHTQIGKVFVVPETKLVMT
jgi:hypothetical protein